MGSPLTMLLGPILINFLNTIDIWVWTKKYHLRRSLRGKKMECAGKGTTRRCLAPPTRRCARCQAVAYCSLSHQIAHWSVHKEECERLEEQMKHADELNDFPFIFAGEATVEVLEKRETRCLFLENRGLHRVKMWMCECQCGILAASNISSLMEGWCLASVLCPCREPQSPLQKQLDTWEDYYEWRSIPLHSPVAILLHWPLTLYWAAQLTLARSLNLEVIAELNIHYLVNCMLFFLPYEFAWSLLDQQFQNIGLCASFNCCPKCRYCCLHKLVTNHTVFTDYCEEASHLAASCLSTRTGRPLSVPIQLNPFRQPLVVEHSGLLLPCYSNCFLFGI
ncbi:uncharacterized protein LOC141725075 isoform X4 [Apium graveolens]|uniref:uncharacterized protein LOC141725075 isoform X4 n=1 Tax=Apium graveolens TaxID=4045 RepID=UPI003D7BE602